MQNDYITIGEVNRYIKETFDNDLFLRKVYIKGEISNFKHHTRGHLYFTLKDETSRINAVMFSYSASKLKFTPIDGMKVLVTGKVSVYESNGAYQIYIDDMIEDGIGNLYVAFEELKKKLASEGLFNQEHKKKIPRIPKKIGIVTASTGAAIKDILTTIKRRYPLCETILFPSLVQGNAAAKDIVNKIEIANTYDIDTLIVGRGGGSIEDLWPFNEEIVARAIYNSHVPVISAVGHEVDFTIADFVADLRAPTPTAAAELAVPDINTISTYLENAKNRSYNAINNYIKKEKINLSKLTDSYILNRPMTIYEIKEQKLDNLIDNINRDMLNVINNNKKRLDKLSGNYILNNPSTLYNLSSTKLEHLINKLELLNPMNTLNRGYSIVRKDGNIITSVNNVVINDEIIINLKDGNFTSKITKIGE